MNTALITLIVAICAVVSVGTGCALVAMDEDEPERETSNVILDNGVDLITDSSLYHDENKFYNGESFTISPLDEDAIVQVSGAIRSPDGSYVVDCSAGPVIVSLTYNEGTMFKIDLPAEQKGYKLTVDKTYVQEGEDCNLTYSLFTGYEDESLVITVNGNPVELDGMKQLKISNVTCDQVITVSGVRDVRSYTITVPDVQAGYSLTSSKSTVNHGESYQLSYALLSDYIHGVDFAIAVNGITFPSVDGRISVENVQSNQVITVTGVESVSHNVIAGSNTILKVNGVMSSAATSNDVITITAAEGYELPANYSSMINGPVTSGAGGFKVSGDVVFPSIIRIAVGDNISANGISENEDLFVCTEDTVTIVARSGYVLPEDYQSHVVGGTLVSGDYQFSANATLPSIYEVRYDLENGSNPIVDYHVNGTTVAMPTIPAREGYSSTGWSRTITRMPAEDLQITAGWDINNYVLTLNPGGGTYDPAPSGWNYNGTTKTYSKTHDYDSNITMPPIPIREGHTSTGWSSTITRMPAEDTTIVVGWDINSYNLTLDPNGGTYDATPSGWVYDGITKTYASILEYDSDVTMPIAPARTGHTFSGWSRTILEMPAEDVTIVAGWDINSYTLTLDPDGGTYDTVPTGWDYDGTTGTYSKVLDYNSTVLMPSVPIREGHSFTAWSRIMTKMPAEDATVVAGWNTDSYTLTLDLNGIIYPAIPSGWDFDIVSNMYSREFDTLCLNTRSLHGVR